MSHVSAEGATLVLSLRVGTGYPGQLKVIHGLTIFGRLSRITGQYARPVQLTKF